MTRFSRRQILITVPLIALLLATATIFYLGRGEDLKVRLQRVSPGMTRTQVEDIFGPAVLFLPNRSSKTGGLLVWVDQLWQVDVTLDSDGKVTRCGCVPLG